MPSINILLTTIGRPELVRMLNSLVNQLEPTDFITIVSDDKHSEVDKMVAGVPFKCPVIRISNPEPLGWWGHGARNKYQNCLPGDYIMHGDDDDRYVDNIIPVIKSKIGEKKLYFFKHQDGPAIAWFKEGIVEIGNCGTSCGVIPNFRECPEWGKFYGGDGDFYVRLSKMLPVVWCNDIIYKVKDTQ